jgi:hypothetical protein
MDGADGAGPWSCDVDYTLGSNQGLQINISLNSYHHEGSVMFFMTSNYGLIGIVQYCSVC